MVFIIVLVFLFLIGLFLGCMLMFNKLTNSKQIRHNNSKEKRVITNTFTDTGDSFSDLFCEVTGECMDDYIETNRTKQNSAYKYAKK